MSKLERAVVVAFNLMWLRNAWQQRLDPRIKTEAARNYWRQDVRECAARLRELRNE